MGIDYVDRLKPLILNRDHKQIEKLFEQFINDGNFPDLFATDVVPKALNALEPTQHHLVSLTDAYRMGKTLEKVFLRVMSESSDKVAWHAHNKKRPIKVMLLTFNDWHELGRVLLGMFLRINSYIVIDIGTISTLKAIVWHAQNNMPDIIAISVLMNNSALRLKSLRAMLDDAGLKHVKVIAGGAPFSFNQKLIIECGFDGTAQYSFEIYGLMEKITKDII